MDWQRFIPGYWYQNGPTCPVWDAVVNKALEQYGVTEADQHSCRIGPLTVWVANWPYAYGKDYSGSFPSNYLPKVATRKKIRDAVRVAMLAQLAAWEPTV